jgi:hypothetical protein
LSRTRSLEKIEGANVATHQRRMLRRIAPRVENGSRDHRILPYLGSLISSVPAVPFELDSGHLLRHRALHVVTQQLPTWKQFPNNRTYGKPDQTVGPVVTGRAVLA